MDMNLSKLLESREKRSLADYRPWGHKESDMTQWLKSSNYSQHKNYSSVQFSCSVMSDSLRPHEPQHTRPPCPSPTPVVHPNPCPSSWWCHPTISSSVVPFSSCPQSFTVSGSSQYQGLFKWVSSSHQWAKYWSFSFNVSPSNEHPRLISFRWTGWISL